MVRTRPLSLMSTALPARSVPSVAAENASCGTAASSRSTALSVRSRSKVKSSGRGRASAGISQSVFSAMRWILYRDRLAGKPLKRHALSSHRVADEIIGEIRRLELELDALRLTRERAAHEDVVLDMRGQHLEDADGAPELGIDVGVDQLLLACNALDHLGLGQALYGLLPHQLPIGLARPTRGGERLWVLIGAAELEDVLAEADVGGPFAELGASRHVERRHGIAPRQARSHCRSAAVTVVGFSRVERCPQSSTTTSLAPGTSPAISSCSASGVKASWRPQRTSVGQLMRRRSSRPSGRPMIAFCWPKNASLPTRSAIPMTTSLSGSSSCRAAWMRSGSNRGVTPLNSPFSESSIRPRRREVCSGVSARAEVSRSANFLTRSG